MGDVIGWRRVLEGKKGEEGRKEGRIEAGVPGGFLLVKSACILGGATLYTRLITVFCPVLLVFFPDTKATSKTGILTKWIWM